MTIEHPTTSTFLYLTCCTWKSQDQSLCHECDLIVYFDCQFICTLMGDLNLAGLYVGFGIWTEGTRSARIGGGAIVNDERA